MEKNQTTGCSFGVGKDDGIQRCACGNTYEFNCVARSFDDGTQEHSIYCKECQRSVTTSGKLTECVEAFNEMNRGAIPLRFQIESAPEIITVYSKNESDVQELLEKELKQQTRLKRLTETDFRTYSKRIHYIRNADIVVDKYAFKRQGDTVTIANLERVNANSTEYGYILKMTIDGDIIESSGQIYDRERIKKLWRKIREVELESKPNNTL